MVLIMSNGFFVSAMKEDDLPEQVNYSAAGLRGADTISSSDSGVEQDPAAVEGEETELPDTEVSMPMFSACIEYSPQGYVVRGTFTELSSDISFVQPLYSLDGENWHICGREWDLHQSNMEGASALEKLQTQTCLYASQEPLCSYLAGELDCFYLKLCLTSKNASTYETQPALLKRSAPQPLPQDFNAIAKFDRSLFVSHMRPYCNYGRYQLTVSADVTAEDIAALLPDTLPIEIQLQKDNVHVAEGIVDCSVTWKPLILPQLVAGHSAVIPDAAEEIVIPRGTLLNTPMGIFELNEPLGINQFSLSDEIRLILNVVAKDDSPTGVLRCGQDGLEMAFDLKPTGATAIHEYIFAEGASEWVELPDPTLLEAVNSQPSAASSSYALVVGNDSELFQLYLEAEAAGEEPAPFYVGLEIEGGVYDGHQLVLAWPDTYNTLPSLPHVVGSGGNEDNAGANNKNDSTEGGQRPNLPQPSEEVVDEQSLEPFQSSEEVVDEQSAGLSQSSEEVVDEQSLEQSQSFVEVVDEQSPEPSQPSMEVLDEQFPEQPQSFADRPEHQQPNAQIIADAGIEEIRPAVSSASDVKIDIQTLRKKNFLFMLVTAIACICIVIVAGKAAVNRKSR